MLALNLERARPIFASAFAFSVSVPSVMPTMVPWSRLVLANIAKARLASSIVQARSSVANAFGAIRAMDAARNAHNFSTFQPMP